MPGNTEPDRETTSPALTASRTLIYCPVSHSVVDLGALGKPVQTATSTALGAEAWRRRVHTVEQMWNEIERLIEAMDLDPTHTRLYQDEIGRASCRERVYVLV